MSKEVILFHNCRVLRNKEIVKDELWVQGARVVAPGDAQGPVRKVNCNNKILAPGFIDMQINGAFGVDYSATKNIEVALQQTSHFLPTTGVTAYVPTIITSAPATYKGRVPRICYDPGNGKKGSSVLGSHLEGPFISLNKRGCHPPELVRGFDGTGMKQIEAVYGPDLKHVLMVTLAPEYPHSDQAIEGLSRRGIVVSLGHSEASHAIGEKGLLAGASALTHLFNAMNAFGHKEPALPGLICSAGTTEKVTKLLDTIMEERSKSGSMGSRLEPPTGAGVHAPHHDSPTNNPVPSNISDVSGYCPTSLHYGLIADGVHTHPACLRTAFRLNRHGLCLITDAICALGLPDGHYRIGETSLEVYGSPRRAIKTGTDTLAGVVQSLDGCMRVFYKEVGCGLAYVLNAASLHPAECLGIASIKGRLDPGYDADFVLIDDQINVLQTWIAGELAYDAATYQPEPIPVETATSMDQTSPEMVP